MADVQAIAASSMYQLMEHMNTISQNIVNASTPSYKSIQSFDAFVAGQESVTQQLRAVLRGALNLWSI